ncbi:MAG TPA: hypothetical protein VLT88_16840 [Desulfosarcina sp.]|nr:hypothetical protein [Desulfosarcina sp.]
MLAASCPAGDAQVALHIPRGYQPVLEIADGGGILTFGPFVGYYFKPIDPTDPTRLEVICFNEERYYTRDLPINAKLFTGEAVFTRLPDTGRPLPSGSRINPIFFADAPEAWLETRPAPQDEFLHFHSCYNATGPARAGFWIRHVGTAAFTYDMGGRVTAESPLYHRVTPGPDKNFARIIEFDQGPG